MKKKENDVLEFLFVLNYAMGPKFSDSLGLTAEDIRHLAKFFINITSGKADDIMLYPEHLHPFLEAIQTSVESWFDNDLTPEMVEEYAREFFYESF